MEKYQKFISLIILFAFFYALGFQIQKADILFSAYINEWHIEQILSKGIAKFVFTWVNNFIV